MVTISSKVNKQVKWIKSLLKKANRDQESVFLVEGVRLVEETLKSGLTRELYYNTAVYSSTKDDTLVSKAIAQGISVFACTEQVFKEISNTVNSQGVLAVAQKPTWPFNIENLVVVADQIQDPGNMGVLFRTATAVGAGGIILTTGCVDPYNLKVVRASMGGILRLPHWQMPTKRIIKELQNAGFKIVIADLEQSVDFFDVHFPKHTALVIGNEAHGPSEDLRNVADMRVKIPLIGEIESLNASVAAGILLYEIVRQKVY